MLLALPIAASHNHVLRILPGKVGENFVFEEASTSVARIDQKSRAWHLVIVAHILLSGGRGPDGAGVSANRRSF